MRMIKLSFVILLAFYLNACALISAVKVSEAQLQTQINKQLPLKKRLLFAGLTVDKFELDLLAGKPNVEIETDFALDILNYPLAQSKAIIRGELEFNAEKQAVFLRRPQLRQLDVSSVPEKYQQQAFDALSKLLIKFFAKQPVYRFDKNKMQISAIQVLPGYLLLQR